jgi:hypothetical protein
MTYLPAGSFTLNIKSKVDTDLNYEKKSHCDVELQAGTILRYAENLHDFQV